MNEREVQLKAISEGFALWEVKINNLNSLNLTDANIISEYSIGLILNETFGYDLKNLNSVKKNQASLDLGDETNKISFQITSMKTSRKIQDTLDKFFENKLDNQYDELFIFIMGKKQQNYHGFSLKEGFSFNPEIHILDFKSLLHFISFLPSNRIRKIGKILEAENIGPVRKKSITPRTRVKNSLRIKNKIKKALLHDDSTFDRSLLFEPYQRFRYYQILVRSIENDNFPRVDSKPGEVSKWLKFDIWDFYDRGLEFIGTNGNEIIFDKDGYWDLVLEPEDPRKNDPKFNLVLARNFFRIPYDYIVDIDMDTDPYYGLPSLYVEYMNDGTPYEEIINGIPGSSRNQKLTHYFDESMKRIL